MKLHHRIKNHIYKHKEKLRTHIQKHHKKYIFGAGVLSGITMAKIFGLLVVFLGLSQTTSTGADYYDIEYEKDIATGAIDISSIIKNEEKTDKIQVESGKCEGVTGTGQ